MCIFNGDIIHVAATQILVVPLANGKQLTIYSNAVETATPNAMILPVLHAAEGGTSGVVPLDASKYSDIYRDCEALFPRPEREVYAMGFGSFGGGGGWGASSEPLPVQRVGGYDVSVVPGIGDFARLSAAHFVVPPNIQQILTEHYGRGFAFLVCRFDKKVQAHPIAYVSSRLPNGRLFIPTRHAHNTNTVGAPAPVPAFYSGAQGGASGPIHQGIHCDACRTSPLVGVRWKCAQCPDYDLCSACYVARQTQHPAHFFVHIPEPVSAPIPIQFQAPASSGGFQFLGKARSVEDDWDHTIFIANGQPTCAPTAYDACKTVAPSATMQTSQINFGIGNILGEFTMFAGIKSMSKMTIKGGGYGNRDYAAMEFE